MHCLSPNDSEVAKELIKLWENRDSEGKENLKFGSITSKNGKAADVKIHQVYTPLPKYAALWSLS